MPRRCSVCAHPQREAIDAALVRQEPYRDISGQYAVSRSALERHRAHIAAELRQARAAEVELTAAGLLAALGALHRKALDLLDKAERAGDIRAALVAVGQARQCIEAAARIIETTELEKRIEALEEALEREGQDD